MKPKVVQNISDFWILLIFYNSEGPIILNWIFEYFLFRCWVQFPTIAENSHFNFHPLVLGGHKWVKNGHGAERCFNKNKQQKWKKICREKKQNKNNTHRGVIKQKAIRHPHTIHSQKMPPSLSCYCSVFNHGCWTGKKQSPFPLP